MTLLLTPLIMLLSTLFIEDENIIKAIKVWVSIYLVDIIFWLLLGQEFYYIRSAITDVCMFLVVFLLQDNLKSLIVGLVCFTSFGMNIYEQWSYYQTWYYPHREVIQWILTQMICIGLLIKCRWRNVCNKTHTQK